MNVVVDEDVCVTAFVDVVLVDAAGVIENILNLSVRNIASCGCACALFCVRFRIGTSESTLLGPAGRIRHFEGPSIAGNANDDLAGRHAGFCDLKVVLDAAYKQWVASFRVDDNRALLLSRVMSGN